NPDLLPAYAAQLLRYESFLLTKTHFAPILFLAASLMTCAMMVLLGMQLPDFFTRALLWLRSLRLRYRLQVVGMNNLPDDGPVILVTNCKTTQSCLQVLSATDRFTRFILVDNPADARMSWLLQHLTR